MATNALMTISKCSRVNFSWTRPFGNAPKASTVHQEEKA
jgi:hypothetical protein